MLDNRMMAETPERVNTFLKQLSDALPPGARKDVEAIRRYAASTGADFELQRWDWNY
jgi:peptidyl-dipeptidase Dcp